MGQKQNTSFASIAHGLVSFKGIKRNAAVIAIVCSLVVQVSADLDSLKKAYMDMKYGMFIHFNMATFEGVQWASPDCDPDMFNPTELDCGQWADAAKAAGMKYMVLTAKHHSGFCLWDSDYTTHDAGSSSWRNGKGDVVKEFADSCRSRGLAVGLYFSIWDRKSGNDPAFIRNQLTELLTNYGTIVMLYFDAWGWYISYDDVPYKPLDDYIKSIQPNCLIVNNDQDHDSNTTDIICYEKGIHPWPDIPDDNKLASETNETMAANNNWFWNSTSSDICDPAEDIIALRNYCHARNTNLLLNVGPNQKGIISDQQLKGLEDTKLFFATVTLPNGGEEIEQGTTYEIEYDNNLDGNVKIELLKGGSVAQVLAASTPSNGIFE